MRLYRWVTALAAMALPAAVPAAGSVDRGMAEFVAKCSRCHSIEAGVHGAGPSLAGVVGRTAGSVEGFDYSSELAGEAFDWNDATLYEYLTIPTQSRSGDQLLHSVNMRFDGLSDQAADDMIAFLQLLGR